MKNLSDVSFLIIKEWNNEEILSLYRDAGWLSETDTYDGITQLISSSFLFVVGVTKEPKRQTVAMGRIISDGVTGIIQDLVVTAENRAQGIGKKLLEFLIINGRKAGLKHIILSAEPNTEDFYLKSGFAKQNKIFMMV